MTTEGHEKEQEDRASRDPPPRKRPQINDEDIDEALEETFPASEPPAY